MPRRPAAGRTNVVLIGMPGSGKSTVGVVLAKRLGMGFVDVDLVIQSAEGRTLQDIVDTEGYVALREAEERAMLSLQVDNAVVATGGSAVYSEPGMAWLRRHGRVILLRVDLATLQRRVGDASRRGIAMRPGQSFASLFEERAPLYEAAADLAVDAAGPTTEAVCERVETALGG